MPVGPPPRWRGVGQEDVACQVAAAAWAELAKAVAVASLRTGVDAPDWGGQVKAAGALQGWIKDTRFDAGK